MPRLLPDLRRIAAIPSLLVALDFDGTLAPIVSNPAEARLLPANVPPLLRLASLPATSLAIISGRPLGDLSRLCRDLPAARLVGSHGAEFEGHPLLELPSSGHADLQRLQNRVAPLARHPGALLEPKPFGAAFHYRNVDPAAVDALLCSLNALLAEFPRLHVRHGKMVVEWSASSAHKGLAIARLRSHFNASAVLFAGDDVTDEDAFRSLDPVDFSLKIGAGDTAAAHRIPSPDRLPRLLSRLAGLRSRSRPA